MKRYTKVRLAAALIALNTAFSAPMVMAAYNANQAKLPQVKEASAYNYVLTKAESGKRSEIVDYKNYCDDILFFEDELRNGSLKGLIDDFDYILPEELSYSYFGFHAFKDGEETSYIFDLSSSAVGSYALTHDFQMNLHEVTNAMREGKLNKSNFNMCYKTSDLARYLYNLSKDKVEEKINSDSTIQAYIKDGYEAFIVPSMFSPCVDVPLKNYKEGKKPSTITIRNGNVTFQFENDNNASYYLLYSMYDILLLKDSTTLNYGNRFVARYVINDENKAIATFMDNLTEIQKFLQKNNLNILNTTVEGNDISINVSDGVDALLSKYNIFDCKDNSSTINLYKCSIFDISVKPYNYFNYSLGRLDDATYEKYIGEEMGK